MNNYAQLCKKNLILVYLLNVLDILFTLYLTSTGMFQEANPILKNIVTNNPLLSLIIKIFIPLCIIIYVIYKINKNPNINYKKHNLLIKGLLFFYIGLNILHFFYFIFYLNIKDSFTY